MGDEARDDWRLKKGLQNGTKELRAGQVQQDCGKVLLGMSKAERCSLVIFHTFVFGSVNHDHVLRMAGPSSIFVCDTFAVLSAPFNI